MTRQCYRGSDSVAPRPRTVGVSLTVEARDALNQLATTVVLATGNRKITQSDAVRVAALLAERHKDEIAALYEQVKSESA
jgi:hypothetical protein